MNPMNSLNDWENRLRSWTPRGPSRTLKQRLFAAAPPPRPAPRPRHAPLPAWPALLTRRLAATAALLALVSLVAAWRPAGTSDAKPLWPAGLIASISLSNQQSVAYQTTRDHSEWNHWHTPIIRWTNLALLPSSAPRFPLENTNTVIH